MRSSTCFLTVVVNFTVSIPNDQKLAGSYWSMLMVEGIPQSSPESSRPMAKKKTEMGIMQTIRYGIQIATHIANTGERKIEFKDPKVVTKGQRVPVWANPAFRASDWFVPFL